MKTELYKTAIKNLLKMKNHSELYGDLENKVITQKEYESEVTENAEKYVIDVHTSDPIKMVPIIVDIINELGMPAKDLSVDEVCTIFSIDSTSFVEEYDRFLKSYQSQVKIDFSGLK